MARHRAPEPADARMAPSTTQQAYPRRAWARTFVQVLIGLPAALVTLSGVLALVAQDPFSRYLPPAWGAWLVAASLFTASLSALLAKVMARPDVDRWLARFRLSSSPRV